MEGAYLRGCLRVENLNQKTLKVAIKKGFVDKDKDSEGGDAYSSGYFWLSVGSSVFSFCLNFQYSNKISPGRTKDFKLKFSELVYEYYNYQSVEQTNRDVLVFQNFKLNENFCIVLKYLPLR